MIIIDDCSRFIVGCGMFFEDNAVNFLSVLKKAIAVYGKPTMLYCDNGAPYANKQLELILADLQIQLIHTPVRDGAAKGYVQMNVMLNRPHIPLYLRDIKSVKNSFTKNRVFTDIDSLNEQCREWL